MESSTPCRSTTKCIVEDGSPAPKGSSQSLCGILNDDWTHEPSKWWSGCFAAKPRLACTFYPPRELEEEPVNALPPLPSQAKQRSCRQFPLRAMDTGVYLYGIWVEGSPDSTAFFSIPTNHF